MKKVGFIRDDIDAKYKSGEINLREKYILVTSLIYAIDRIANTVGHYDAYRKNGDLSAELKLLLPAIEKLPYKNTIYKEDGNELAKTLSADLVYIDPPYNSRQYCDAYHFLENVAENKSQSFSELLKRWIGQSLKAVTALQKLPMNLKI